MVVFMLEQDLYLRARMYSLRRVWVEELSRKHKGGRQFVSIRPMPPLSAGVIIYKPNQILTWAKLSLTLMGESELREDFSICCKKLWNFSHLGLI